MKMLLLVLKNTCVRHPKVTVAVMEQMAGVGGTTEERGILPRQKVQETDCVYSPVITYLQTTALNTEAGIPSTQLTNIVLLCPCFSSNS